MIEPSVAQEDKTSSALWSWPEGRRLYRLAALDGRNARNAGYRQVVAYDDTSLAEVGRAPLTPGAYHTANGFLTTGQPHTVAVDGAGGRLFVAHLQGNVQNDGFADVEDRRQGANEAAAGQVCTNAPSSQYSLVCLGGFHVLDAATLAPVREPIRMRSVSVDGGAVARVPRAMAYASPRAGDDGGKLLVVVEEHLHNVHVGDPSTRSLQGVYYAVQIDPVSGVQEWAVRLDACRSSREPTSGEPRLFSEPRPHPGVIFRTLDMQSPAVWVGCHGPSQQAVALRIPLTADGRPAALPVVVGDPDAVAEGAVDGAEPSAAGMVVQQAPASQAFFGPERAFEILADPPSERLLFKVIEGDAEVWWIFDGRKQAFLGTIGIGKLIPNPSGAQSAATVDQRTGRLYVAWQRALNAEVVLYLADTRRSVVAQAVGYELGTATIARKAALSVVSREGEPTTVFVPVADGVLLRYLTVRDAVASAADATIVDELGRGATLDLDEVEGVTAATLDGAARGYGARLLLVGGADAATRVGRLDGPSAVKEAWVSSAWDGARPAVVGVLGGYRPVSPCSANNREVILGLVGPQGPAVVDGGGSRGGAAPVVIDQALRADGEAAVSRCTPVEWGQVWGKALFGSAPIDEPVIPWPFGERTAECVSAAEETADAVGDPVLGAFAATVRCAGDEDQASGHAYARGTTLGEVTIAEALSSFRIYRDPGRGVVSRVESVARGVSIPGVLRIDTVRGVGESWANGRRQPVSNLERDAVYASNCDGERTAGTCHRRQVFGVWTPGYQCGPCGDERRAVESASRGMGANGSMRLRDPDPRLAAGAENGAIAAIQKPEHERFGDLTLNDDLFQTMVPTLEIIRQAPAQSYALAPTDRPVAYPRGRQIVQLAGLEVSSSYGIACLLVYDEATNTCAAAAEPPGGIQVSLHDPDGEPLAGGAFELRADVDGDGVVGLADALLPNGACVTADDGVGTCTFDNLAPASYLVSQVAAPPGYGRTTEPFLVQLAGGEMRTVAFTNATNVSTIALQATDEHGAPIAGAGFAAYPDPDADGKVASDAAPAAQCATDADGACAMRVPAGSYVLVQTSAPGGLETIEPVPFTFASGGQTAAVTVVNHPPDAAAPPPAAVSPTYTPPVDVAAPTQTIDDYPTTETAVSPQVASSPSLGEHVGGTVVQVIRAPGDALRLLTRDPAQALAWTAAISLFCLAILAVRRRQQAIRLIQH